jgi:tRNA threonylcarbamoyladenosine modification (KEOPS) complex  Pcc1 subunit
MQDKKNLSSKYLIDTGNVDHLYQSIAPELKTIGFAGRRASVTINKTTGRLIINIKASDVTSCRAATNSWLRLALIATEIDELITDVLEQYPHHPST